MDFFHRTITSGQLNSKKSNAIKPWKGFTLVLPAISVGNVGQLCVDLLISKTDCSRVGYIYDEGILPIAGNDPYSTTSDSKLCKLCTSCDVYSSEIDRMIIIQQRAPFVKGKRKDFRTRLVSWIKAHEFERVVLLSSMFAHARSDQQIYGSQYRYMCTETARPLVNGLEGWLKMEETRDEAGEKAINMPGSGIAKTLHKDACEVGIPLVTVIAFCSEGDNAPDAIKLANHITESGLISICQPSSTTEGAKWNVPKSWELNFGNKFDQVIYN